MGKKHTCFLLVLLSYIIHTTNKLCNIKLGIVRFLDRKLYKLLLRWFYLCILVYLYKGDVRLSDAIEIHVFLGMVAQNMIHEL